MDKRDWIDQEYQAMAKHYATLKFQANIIDLENLNLKSRSKFKAFLKQKNFQS